MALEVVDFVIVTALEEERDAVLALLPDCVQLPPTTDDTRVYFQSDLPVTFSDGEEGAYRLVVMPLIGMGRVAVAVVAEGSVDVIAASDHAWAITKMTRCSQLDHPINGISFPTPA